MSAPYKITWMDRRRTGRMVTVPTIEDAELRLRNLRANATCRNSEGDIIGGVSDDVARDLPGTAKWTWWIDNDG